MFTKCVQRCTAAVKLVRLQTSRRHPSVSASVRGGHKRLCGFHIKIKKRLAYCSQPERMGESCNVIEWSMSPWHLVRKSYYCDCCQTSNIINERFPISCNHHNLIYCWYCCLFSEMFFLVLDWSLYIFGILPLTASLVLLYKFKLKPKPVRKLQ